MLYLEARCLSLVRAAGSQGVQNGSISCVALALAVPGGTREVLAENVLAAWLDLEVASGNDAIASHSEIRKTAKLMGQFLPGTDFVTSGYSAIPRYDNMFGGGNFDSDDLDEWLTLQRDWQVDAGIEPLDEETALAIRARGARAIQSVFDAFGFPPITDEEVRLATTCLDSRDLPDRDRAADVAAADRVFTERISGLDVARALDAAGFQDVAERRLRDAAAEGRRRLPPDLGGDRARRDGRLGGQRPEHATRARAPATGWRAHGGSGCDGSRTRSTRSSSGRARHGEPSVEETGEARRSARATDVVGRGRACVRRRALGDDRRPLARRRPRCAHHGAFATRGAEPRLVRVRRSSDVAFIGHDGARLAGSAVAIGIQSKGTTVIHRADTRAARPARALRDGAVADARVVPSDRPQRRRLRARAGRSRRCRRCSTTTPGRS